MNKSCIFLLFFPIISLFSCAPNEDVIIDEEKIDVTFNSSPSGKIKILNGNNFKINDICEVEIIPNSGYYLSDLNILNGSKINYKSENVYTFKVLEEKNHINATFLKANSSISIGLKIISNEHGRINFTSSIFKENIPLKFVVQPDDDYEIEKLIVNESEIKITESNLYSFTPRANLNFIEIKFKECDDETKYEIVDEMIVEKTIIDTTILNEGPYLNIDHADFYSSYSYASSFEDALYRTKNYLLSGDISPQSHLSNENYKIEDKPKYKNSYLMNAYMRYEVDINMNYVSYSVNYLDGEPYKIYYKAAYQSLNDVAAYLFAFSETPVNWYFDKSISKEELKKWDDFARVNVSTFSGNTTKYPYEPLLTGINDKYNYYECDFGTIGDYFVGDRYEDIYNNGEKITRGAARFVFNYSYKNGNQPLNENERHVFYTYNHYNDFEEYLNYNGGFSSRFGNESVGNKANEVNSSNPPSNPKKIYKAIL